MDSTILFHNTNFNNLPNELILLMAYFLDPISLYNFMFTSKKNFYIIMTNTNGYIPFPCDNTSEIGLCSFIKTPLSKSRRPFINFSISGIPIIELTMASVLVLSLFTK